MKHRLVICEKPSVARSIAAVLNANERKGGFFIGGGNIVTWCAGHLLELAMPEAYGEKYRKWRYADLPIIPEKWIHSPVKSKENQLNIIKELMNRSDVDCVVNACDAGREGEHIFRLVYDFAGCELPIHRLWVSSMEETAIRKGFDSLINGKDYENLFAAASCREKADWVVGLNATRVFSILYGVKLNTGRVQSPTLAMIVKRDTDISSFVSEPFYTPVIDCGGFFASGERTPDRNAAEMIRAACDGKSATVRTVERKKKTESPPKLYDLTSLQRDANRLDGYSAQQTLEYAQALYEKGYISYPRSDCRYLTEDMTETVESLLRAFGDIADLSGFPDPIDYSRLLNTSKVSDHHALLPTSWSISADNSLLPVGERRIWNLISTRFLCALAAPHVYEEVTAVLDCEGYAFFAKGKTVHFGGWKEVATTDLDWKKDENCEKDPDDETYRLPDINDGNAFHNVAASVKEGKTTPPKHMTDDTLLSAMENAGSEDMPDDVERKGLGTPATRAAVIEKLIANGFVDRKKKSLVPTVKGKNLIAILPDTLTSAKMTADWEQKLKQVERGELSADAFMDKIVSFTREIVIENTAPKSEFIDLFGGKKADAPSLGSCPRCGAAVREAKQGFFCDDRSCGFKLWKGSKFWTIKKMPLTAGIVAALLNDGSVFIKDFTSEKTGKKYDATVVLEDTGDKYVNFKMEYNKQK